MVTLCELNGVFQSSEEDDSSSSPLLHLSLPLAPADEAGCGAGGYGFQLPHPPAQQLHGTPVRRGRCAARVPAATPQQPIARSAAAMVTVMQQGLERGIKRALSHDAIGATPTTPRVESHPISWQSPAVSLSQPSNGIQSPGVRQLFAAALVDHSVAIFDLNLRDWSSHKLVCNIGDHCNYPLPPISPSPPPLLHTHLHPLPHPLPHPKVHTHQRGVESLAWQPQGASVLAVGCLKGVCIWRLTSSATTGELTGGHMLRLLEEPGQSPVCSLCWHPRGKWLAAGP